MSKQYVSFEKARLIVFWTKDPEPIMEHLDEIDNKGIGYYFQYTLNDYEEEKLEPHIPLLKKRTETFKALSDKIGKEKVIWRFDPLVLTDAVTKEGLVVKVENLMKKLTGYTEKLVISFFRSDDYKHALKRMKQNKVNPRDFEASDITFLARELGALGKKYNMKIATCADKGNLSLYGIEHNKCIDDELIKRVFNKDKILMSFLDRKKNLKDPGQKKDCKCIVSEDIGTNSTCANECLYCYANKSGNALKKNLKRIENGEIGEFLIPKSPEKQKEKLKNPEMSDGGKNWNVVTGCDKYSEGCLNCYAEDTAAWLKGMGQKVNEDNGFNLTMHLNRLNWPLEKLSKEPKRPVRCFVTDMGDLFHKKVTDEFIFQTFETMLKVPQHRFYVLTKRAERLGKIGPELPWRPWIWAGVTVGSSKHIDRIDYLKQLPQDVNKFLMLEPLLSDMPKLDLEGIQWVVVGGETNKSMKFRGMKEEWVINIRDQVKNAGLPFMFKHWPGKTHNASAALLEGEMWQEYPESILNNMDWDD